MVGRRGQLVARIAAEKGDTDIPGWLRRKGHHLHNLGVLADQRPVAERLTEIDDRVRATVQGGQMGAYLVRAKDTTWTLARRQVALGQCELVSPGNGQSLLAIAEYSPWRLTATPFAAAEDVPARSINLHGAQLAYSPVAGPHPTWDLVLSHCGQRLSPNYLLLWATNLIRRPECRLPYLFLYGPQNSGKSTYHEALSLLFREMAPGIRPGVVAADRAITGQFSGEIAGGVLVYIEETNVAKSPCAYHKIKDWVTADTVWVHPKFGTPYATPNYMHFVQAANDRDACPLEFGDTRITVAYVARPESDIPKPDLLARLRAEAPAIMATIMGMDLPAPKSRLALEVAETEDKRQATEASVDPLATGLVSLMAGSRSMTLTVAQMRDLLPDAVPGNIRAVATRLGAEGASAYLEAHGIRHTIIRAASMPAQLHLTAA